MFQFVGYDFFSGPDCLRSSPSDLNDIYVSRLANAIYDHFNATKDLSLFGDKNIPDKWTYESILDATFNNTTGAGNLDYIVSQISGIKIKRRKRGDFDWVTLKYIPVNKVEDLAFTFNDFLNAYGVEYEYSLVPVASGVEGDYIIDSVLSKFSGVFIGDSEQSFKMMYEVGYSGNARKQSVGTFEPLGRKFPIIVANGVQSFESGNVSATILNDNFDITGEIDRNKIVEKKKKIKDYLSDKKPKILKDWNGELWLVMITSDIAVEYKQGSGMGVPSVQFGWTEIGDAENQQSLYEAGIVDIIE